MVDIYRKEHRDPMICELQQCKPVLGMSLRFAFPRLCFVDTCTLYCISSYLFAFHCDLTSIALSYESRDFYSSSHFVAIMCSATKK